MADFKAEAITRLEKFLKSKKHDFFQGDSAILIAENNPINILGTTFFTDERFRFPSDLNSIIAVRVGDNPKLSVKAVVDVLDSRGNVVGYKCIGLNQLMGKIYDSNERAVVCYNKSACALIKDACTEAEAFNLLANRIFQVTGIKQVSSRIINNRCETIEIERRIPLIELFG